MLKQYVKCSPLGDIKEEHNFRVRIPWELNVNNISPDKVANDWNEHCARAIELFGLPGDKFSCRMTTKAIEFWFREEKDAVFFELTCG